MPAPITEEFIRALHSIESTNDVEPLVTLSAEDIQLFSLNQPEPYEGTSGAREFWRNYRALFQTVRSRFTHVIEADGSAVLEWESEGRLENGDPIQYRGVSIVTFEGSKIKRFSTYYDSAAFLSHAPR